MDNIKHYIAEDSIAITKFILASLFLIYIFKLWVYSTSAWLHPELLGTAAYVWCAPDTEKLPQLLRKIFDWKAFDPNVNRVRPLNDVVEVCDAVLRPYLAKFMGPHPSFSISSLLTLVLAPGFLFGFLNRILKKPWLVLVLCMIFLSSTGLLSLIVSYIRPAKKLNMVMLCFALYLGQRHAEKEKSMDFSMLCVVLMASFFSDELGLANFFICGLLFWQSLFKSKQKIILYCALPLLFLILTKWGLPYIYLKYSVHGAWNALNDSKKFTVFTYLLNYKFYYAALVYTARSFLTTFGIYKHVFWTEISALVILIALPLVQIVRYRQKNIFALLSDRFILVSALMFLVNIYDTLLDWYPFPFEIGYLGSFNYYYHSNIVVIIIVWLAFLLENIIDIFKFDLRKMTAFTLLCTVMGALIITANFMLFQKVNTLVQIIHLYPFTEKELKEKLTYIQYNYTAEAPLQVDFITNRLLLRHEFEVALKSIFNERWKENGFYQTFNLITPNPIMGNAYLYHLTRAYYPFYKISVLVNHRPV